MSETVALLMWTIPASISRDRAMALERSLVSREEDRPYSLSLQSLTASCGSFALMMEVTGPKLSS